MDVILSVRVKGSQQIFFFSFGEMMSFVHTTDFQCIGRLSSARAGAEERWEGVKSEQGSNVRSTYINSRAGK
jgi:hypothetical protein